MGWNKFVQHLNLANCLGSSFIGSVWVSLCAPSRTKLSWSEHGANTTRVVVQSLWVQSLNGPFIYKLDLMILLGPFQLRIFCDL